MKAQEFAALGEYFREAREAADFSQKDLADELGYSSPQMVSNWERGLCAPPVLAIAQMIVLLGISKSEVTNLILSENKKFLDRELTQPRRGSKKGAA